MWYTIAHEDRNRVQDRRAWNVAREVQRHRGVREVRRLGAPSSGRAVRAAGLQAPDGVLEAGRYHRRRIGIAPDVPQGPLREAARRDDEPRVGDQGARPPVRDERLAGHHEVRRCGAPPDESVFNPLRRVVRPHHKLVGGQARGNREDREDARHPVLRGDPGEERLSRHGTPRGGDRQGARKAAAALRSLRRDRPQRRVGGLRREPRGDDRPRRSVRRVG